MSKIENDLVEFSNANLSLRSSRNEDRTTIENLQQEILRYKKFSGLWIRSLIIFFVVVILGLISWRYWTDVVTGLDWVWKTILGIGAGWSFGSFVINLIKALKNK
jgi:hypothetical protein